MAHKAMSRAPPARPKDDVTTKSHDAAPDFSLKKRDTAKSAAQRATRNTVGTPQGNTGFYLPRGAAIVHEAACATMHYLKS